MIKTNRGPKAKYDFANTGIGESIIVEMSLWPSFKSLVSRYRKANGFIRPDQTMTFKYDFKPNSSKVTATRIK